MMNFKKGDDMRHFCSSLLLCGIAFLFVPAANAQDVVVRRVTDRVITLSMTNLGTHTNITVIETRKGLVCIETEFVPSIMETIKEAAEKELGRKDWAYVINSHGHLHHAGGNAAFPDTPIIGPEKTMMDRLKRQLSSAEGRKGYCDFAGVTSGIKALRQNLARARLTAEQRETLRRRLRFCYEIQKEIMAGFEVRNPTIAYDELNKMDMGDTHLRLTYWGDGISHSSIFVHVVEDNLLVGMGMSGERWLPGFDGRNSLEDIRHSISVFKGLCDENFRIDVMIGIHKPYLNKSRQRFQQAHSYLQTLLDDLTQAQQDGLSLQQAKAEFSLNKQYAHFCRYFTLPEPERREKSHQETINTIWELLQKEGPPYSTAHNH